MAPISPYPSANSSSQNHRNHCCQHTLNGTDRLSILHLGDPIEYNHDLHNRLQAQYHIIRPPLSELTRSNFIKHLKDRTWGNFAAIMRPFWNTGGEMGVWDRELIELLPPSMKIMASAGAGFDWVSVEVLSEYGILYSNGAGASTESVADMALYHILSTFRHLAWSTLSARSLSPTRFHKAHVQIPAVSHNPRGHTLGIVGLGNIGFAIARKVHAALGMRILYTDIAQKAPAVEREVNATFYPTLPALMARSACLLLATPAGPALLTATTLPLLPRGARIVNIARGSLIDEDALVDALEAGHISAAGLDVHRNEPYVNKRLAGRTDVSLTCHTGGASLETMVGFERLVLENVESVLGGGRGVTVVNRHALRERRGTGFVNGHANGNADGHLNGDHTNPSSHTNGIATANGHPYGHNTNEDGHANGHANGHLNGSSLHDMVSSQN